MSTYMSSPLTFFETFVHGSGELNMEHSEMLRCLKRRMRKVLLGRDSDAGRSVHMPSVRHMSSLWVHIAGGTLESARGAISTVNEVQVVLASNKQNMHALCIQRIQLCRYLTLLPSHRPSYDALSTYCIPPSYYIPPTLITVSHPLPILL